ncbi:hypothetical protein CEXT_320641 [Caerostris extrusa]|uniref:Uncharacterized protein n=1 Tax=Caerostris extrusa TaxID=172846 RepID=A0AAV4WIR3_CAEEX|nr:hypothetical protein CEXT_320641 [Caerostris extrusa]
MRNLLSQSIYGIVMAPNRFVHSHDIQGIFMDFEPSLFRVHDSKKRSSQPTDLPFSSHAMSWISNRFFPSPRVKRDISSVNGLLCPSRGSH